MDGRGIRNGKEVMGIFIEFLGARETGENKMKISALMELTVCWGKHVVKVESTKPADPLDVRKMSKYLLSTYYMRGTGCSIE